MQVSYAPHHIFQFTATRRAASVLLELLWLALLAWMEPFETFLPVRTGAVAVATGVYIITQITDACAFECLRPRDTEWNAYVAAKRIAHFAIGAAITVNLGTSIAASRRCAFPSEPSQRMCATQVVLVSLDRLHEKGIRAVRHTCHNMPSTSSECRNWDVSWLSSIYQFISTANAAVWWKVVAASSLEYLDPSYTMTYVVIRIPTLFAACACLPALCVCESIQSLQDLTFGTYTKTCSSCFSQKQHGSARARSAFELHVFSADLADIRAAA